MRDFKNDVFEDVQGSLKFRGENPTDPSFFIGDWKYCFGLPQNSPVFAYQSFFVNGDAPERAADGSWNEPKNRWTFNEDRSFSLWTLLEPMPEFDIVEPTSPEERYHVLLKGHGEFVLFNDDGSVVKVYARA
jgi:hypothetical protein